MVQALQRMDAPPACITFYREHVEADAVHEQMVRYVVGDLVAREPQLDRGVVFGSRELPWHNSFDTDSQRGSSTRRQHAGDLLTRGAL